MTRLFVAFNFSHAGLLSRKITGFRKRFDPNYNKYSFPHMAVLAPFEVDEPYPHDLAETLKEELETFFYGTKNCPKLEIAGLGVHEHKRKSILHLRPQYSADLRYCSEIILDICSSFISRKFHYRPNKEQFLPLGYFSSSQDLREVMNHAQIEFKSNSVIPIRSISLYQRKLGLWAERDVLIDFEENDSAFLQSNQVFV